MNYAELLDLPREAEALHARLRQNPIPADLEAALLRSAALIPGIKLIKSERDVAGRPGVGVAVDHAGYRNVLIFNRDSYELLGENERHNGELTGGSAVMESRVLDSTREPTVTK